MKSRFLMKSFDNQLLPLSFDADGTQAPLLVSADTPWRGLPFELHALSQVHNLLGAGPPPGRRRMLVLLEGAIRWTTSSCGKEVHAEAGSTMFHDGEQEFPFRSMSGQAKGMVFDVSRVWHRRMLDDGGPETFIGIRPLPASETVRALALAIYNEVASGARTGENFAESLSLALTTYVVQHIPSAHMRVRGSFSQGQQRRLLRYLDAHIHNDVSLQDIAALTGLRQRHFSTLFRKAFGTSPYQFLIERRLKHGARLLTSTTLDVAEIAVRVGFSSQSRFAATFRKRFGCTPSQYVLMRVGGAVPEPDYAAPAMRNDAIAGASMLLSESS